MKANPSRSRARNEYGAQFNVCIDKRIRHALAIEAARAGLWLNALMAQKLAQIVGESPAERRKARR